MTERGQPPLRDARRDPPRRARAHGADTDAVLAELGVDADGARAPARGGRRVSVPPLTWLYVPADRPDRVEKAIASRAHAVIVDLEDGVAPRGEGARRARTSPALLGERREKPVYVRVNAGQRRRPRGRRAARDRRRLRAEGRARRATCPARTCRVHA